MKKLTVILVFLCTLLLLSGCVTAKKANELVDERLQGLYPDIDFEALNSRTITLAEKQAEIEEAVTLANQNINSALGEGISRIDLKATETEQFIESVSQQAQQSIKEKTDSAERSLHIITMGATEELNKSLASVKQQLNTIVSGSVSTVAKKAEESVTAVNKAVSDAQTTMQATVSGSVSTVAKKAEESVTAVNKAVSDAQTTMHTLVTGSVTEIENARLKAQQNINTLISGGLEQIRTASKLEAEAIAAIEDALKAELSAAKQSTLTEISGHRAQASDAYKAYEEKVQTAFTEIDVMKKNTETFLKGLEVQYKDFILGLIKNEGQALYDHIIAEKDAAITSIQIHQKATEQKIDATESYMSGLKLEFQKHVEEQVAIIEEMKAGLQEDYATYRSSVDTMSHGTIHRINETADNLNSKFTSLEKQYESLVTFLQGLSKLQ